MNPKICLICRKPIMFRKNQRTRTCSKDCSRIYIRVAQSIYTDLSRKKKK